jgi:predicted ATPase
MIDEIGFESAGVGMLLRFAVGNHRSVMEAVELSMIAVDDDRPATRGFERLSERVLTTAAIYGANASGKSNVLQALAWLADAVDQSLRQREGFLPRQPFRFGAGPSSASTYEVEMMVGGIRHTYAVQCDDSSIVSESLFSYPERRRRLLFEREGMALSFRRGLTVFSAARELMTPTTLALSAALRFDDAEVGPFGRALAGIGALNFPRRVLPSRAARDTSEFATRDLFVLADREPLHDPDARRIALGLLRLADLGVDDVEVVRERSGSRLQLVHHAAGERVAFELDEESEGTRTWFALIGPVLDALQTGQILLFDEIDASLHPRLSGHLLALFQDEETNPHGAQLIFTTHDTSLLGQLNRDEVWLTEKGTDGATRLTALAEYGGDKVRRSTNLERAYLQGRFGGLPQIDEQALRQALVGKGR